jgi:hypothetical protein
MRNVLTGPRRVLQVSGPIVSPVCGYGDRPGHGREAATMVRISPDARERVAVRVAALGKVVQRQYRSGLGRRTRRERHVEIGV